MIDALLMIFVSVHLQRRCKQAGVYAAPHIIRMLGYWLISEALGVYLFMRLGIQTLATALMALGMGLVAGYLSFQKSMEEIAALSRQDDDTPRLPQ
jgi:lipopolysaccharide export LptBFGC system permease protein LptF